STHGPAVRHDNLSSRTGLSESLYQSALEPHSWTYIVDVSGRLYTPEANHSPLHCHRGNPGSGASAHRMGRSYGNPGAWSIDVVWHALSLAIPALYGNRVDVPRRLRAGRISGPSQFSREAPLRSVAGDYSICAHDFCQSCTGVRK